MTALLELRGVGRAFAGLQALDGIDLDIHAGERIGLIGPNGSGKTTLVNCIAGRLVPSAGTIRFDGQDITGWPAHRRARLGIARGFQIPQPFLGLTLLENLLVPLEFGRQGRAGASGRALGILHRFGLADRAGQRPDALSQVDLRRLELARAMAGAPRLLIADEVMAGLSDSEADAILAILHELAESGITILMIEHIMRAVRAFAGRVICLVAGQKVADGTPDQVLSDPLVERAYLGE